LTELFFVIIFRTKVYGGRVVANSVDSFAQIVLYLTSDTHDAIGLVDSC